MGETGWIFPNLLPLAIMFIYQLSKMENDLLEIVSKSGERTAVTVYGKAHDWKDNIETWNREHPDEKFSLIVVTPEKAAEE